MNIAMIDPSLFTIPYDCELAHALQGLGGKVTLYGRPLRKGEALSSSIRMVERFYEVSERLPHAMRKPIKGIEHIVDMSLFMARMMLAPPLIIHFQWCPLPLLDARAVRILRGVAPVVLTVHDPHPYNGTNLGLMNSGALTLPTYFDAVIVHSEAGKAQLVSNGVVESKIYVMPHGPLRVRSATAVAAPHDKFNILFFGNIKPYKGLDILIAALAQLSPELKQKVHLMVVGQPAMNIAELRVLAERSGISVTWELRFIADHEIDFWLSQSDLFVFPYRNIDASGVMMSCLRYGKPIIATRIGVFAEILEEDVHGFLIDPGRPPEAFTDAIARIMSDPTLADRMGRAVGRLVERLPTWDDIALSTMKVYRDIRERWCSTENQA